VYGAASPSELTSFAARMSASLSPQGDASSRRFSIARLIARIGRLAIRRHSNSL
jgi:hypothetical protein